MRGAVGLDRLDEQPQRHPDARVPDDARRGRDRRTGGTGAAVGRPGAGVSGRRRRPVRRRGAPGQERAAARLARDRPAEDDRHADRAGRRRRGRRAGRCRGHEGRMARRPRRARRGLRRADGAAVAVRPARLRPGARSGAVRLRVHARDVQARRQAPLGLLRPAHPPRRPAGREGRRRCRPQGLRVAGQRDPRGREVHPCDDKVRQTPSSRTWLRGSLSTRSSADDGRTTGCARGGPVSGVCGSAK